MFLIISCASTLNFYCFFAVFYTVFCVRGVVRWSRISTSNMVALHESLLCMRWKVRGVLSGVPNGSSACARAHWMYSEFAAPSLDEFTCLLLLTFLCLLSTKFLYVMGCSLQNIFRKSSFHLVTIKSWKYLVLFACRSEFLRQWSASGNWVQFICGPLEQRHNINLWLSDTVLAILTQIFTFLRQK